MRSPHLPVRIAPHKQHQCKVYHPCSVRYIQINLLRVVIFKNVWGNLPVPQCSQLSIFQPFWENHTEGVFFSVNKKWIFKSVIGASLTIKQVLSTAPEQLFIEIMCITPSCFSRSNWVILTSTTVWKEIYTDSLCNISNMRRTVSSPDETQWRELKILRAAEYFLTNFEVF